MLICLVYELFCVDSSLVCYDACLVCCLLLCAVVTETVCFCLCCKSACACFDEVCTLFGALHSGILFVLCLLTGVCLIFVSVVCFVDIVLLVLWKTLWKLWKTYRVLICCWPCLL